MNESVVERDPVEELADSFLRRLRAGECPTAEEYVAQYPELADLIRDLLPVLASLDDFGREFVESQVLEDGVAIGDASPSDESTSDGARVGDDESRVVAALEEYLTLRRTNVRPNRGEFLNRHPEIAGALGGCLDALNFVQSAASHYALSRRCGFDAERIERELQFGDFRILREIGRGGMGLVFEAEQVSLGRRVALKVLPHRAFKHDSQIRRFEREAKAAARLHHANIVPVFGVGCHNGNHYYVMQFIPGTGLDRVLEKLKAIRETAGATASGPDRKPGTETGEEELSASEIARRLIAGTFSSCGASGAATLPVSARPDKGNTTIPTPTESAGKFVPDRRYWRSVARIGIQAAEALEHAHAQEILHRDIKPSNLLLDHAGTVWVTDFGLAKATNVDAANLTNTGDIVGTIRYMAPERFQGQDDNRSDIYSLGLTLYELLALRPAFEAKDRAHLVQRVAREEPQQLRRVNPSVPRDLETIVHKAIARDPSSRYCRAADLGEDLRRFVDSRPILARRTGAAEQAWRWCVRNPLIAGLAGLLILVLSSGTVASTLFAFRANREAASANKQKGLSDRRYYLADMNVAHMAWEHGETGRALRCLEVHTPPNWGAIDERGFEWWYLDRLVHSELSTIPTPEGWISDLGFTPDCRSLATVNPDGLLAVRDAFTGRVERTIRTQQRGVVMALHPDGQRIATRGFDGGIKIWDRSDGALKLSVTGRAGWVGSLAFSPDGERLASGGQDRSIEIWDPNTAARVAWIRTRQSNISSLVFSPDGRYLAAAGAETAVSLYDTTTGDEARKLEGHERPAMLVAYSPSGELVATGARDGTVKVWDAATGRNTVSLRGHARGVRALAFTPDSGRLASAGQDNMIKLWDPATGKELSTRRGHRRPVTALAFSPDGWRLASAASDSTIKIWDSAGEQDSQTLRGHGGAATAVAFSPNGHMIASAGEDGTAVLWDAASGQDLMRLRGHVGGIEAISFAPDGNRLATAGLDHLVKLWDPRTGRELLTFTGHEGARVTGFLTCGVAFSPDVKLVASAAFDREIKLWDPLTGREIRTLKGHERGVNALAFRPDGRVVASTSQTDFNTGEIILWDVATGAKIKSARVDGGPISRLSFSPDSTRLATTHGDGSVRLWDSTMRRELQALRGHDGYVQSVTFSPDGHRLATAGHDGTVKVWDTVLCQELLTLRGHQGAVVAIAFRWDGRQLASAGDDGVVKIWDARPISPADREYKEAQAVVQNLFKSRDSGGQSLSAQTILNVIQSTPTLGEGARRQALGLAEVFTSARTRREADAAVQRGVQAGLLEQELMDALRADATLTPDARGEALQIVERYPAHPRAQWLWESSRHIAEDFGTSRAACDRALAQADAACRLAPNRADYLSTLGLAQFRAGRDSEAVETLSDTIRLRGKPHWLSLADLALVAVARQRLGQVERARKGAQEIQNLLKETPGCAQASPQSVLFRELRKQVESLIESECPIQADQSRGPGGKF
jgi:WD40 repeat protein/serine/threonine protein kinase